MKKYFVIESKEGKMLFIQNEIKTKKYAEHTGTKYREANDEEKKFIRENNLTHKQYFPKGEDIENKTVEVKEEVISSEVEVKEETVSSEAEVEEGVKTKGRKKNS